MDVPEMPLLDEQPPTVAQLEAEDEQLAAEAQKAALGWQMWKLHNRQCRRKMIRMGIEPVQLEAHLAACSCGWPAARLQAWQREQEKEGGE